MRLPIQTYLEEIHKNIASDDSGELASYIPELTKAMPSWFGICLVTMDGLAYAVGDADQAFTMQSISKPFVYATALADRGVDSVRARVGVEPSGDAFNSISLDPQTGAPINPMINVGAIATTSLVGGETPERQWERILDSLGRFAGRKLDLDEAVYRSESATGHRNRAIAWMLKNFGAIDGEPMASLENYFRQCSILVTCRDLAMMAATLANDGVHPANGERVLSPALVEKTLSVMATCGMYDYSGNWLYEIGMPAKSGVGGGIIAVLPGRFGIGIFSPLLDRKGNSVRGIEVCKRLSKEMRLHVFTHLGDPRMALGRTYTGADAPSRRQPDTVMKGYLKEHAHRIKFFCLHGYVAVDGIEYVIRRMQRVAGETHSFVLDMHQVDGLSESAAKLLAEARASLANEGIAVVFSRIQGRQAIMGPLDKSIRKGDAGFLSFEDNDVAAEWCENRLVGEADLRGEPCRSLNDCALFAGVPDDIVAKVTGVARSRSYRAGECIIRAGEESDGQIFFLQEGHVSILVPLEDHDAHQRIASLGPRMSFGEMLLLGNNARSATVHADTDVKCWSVSAADLKKISEVSPQLKIIILRNLATDLAGKLRRATQWIGALA